MSTVVKIEVDPSRSREPHLISQPFRARGSTRPALAVDGLSISSAVEIVSNVSFAVGPGECLGLVGESGSGKSLTLRAVIGLLPSGVRATAGVVTIGDVVAQGGTPSAPSLPGRVGMVFQEPMTALNPSMRIGRFLEKCIRGRRDVSRAEARQRAVALLRDLGMPDPERTMRAWPHELSGGLRQRVLIAAALSSEPDVLLCDEPTTALDVTIQDQILDLIDSLRVDRDLAIVFVTHDLGVVAKVAKNVAVMYAGKVVETGPTGEVFRDPRHPYTAALVNAMPDVTREVQRLATIPGSLPPVGSPPPGCRYAPRCSYADAACLVADERLVVVGEGRSSACVAPERIKASSVQ